MPPAMTTTACAAMAKAKGSAARTSESNPAPKPGWMSRVATSSATNRAPSPSTQLGEKATCVDPGPAALREDAVIGRRIARQPIGGAHQGGLVGVSTGITSTTRPPKITMARSQASCISSSSEV